MQSVVFLHRHVCGRFCFGFFDNRGRSSEPEIPTMLEHQFDKPRMSRATYEPKALMTKLKNILAIQPFLVGGRLTQ